MRIASAITIATLSTTPLAAFAQECQERVKASSIAALDGYARKYGLVVAASQMASSIEEIATTLCSRPDASVIALAEERIGRVVEKYVSDAAEYGHASRIGAIVGEIFDGQNAIARPDRRRYAVLAVMCSVPITDSRVDIADEEKGSCGDRFMVDVGTIAVRVRSDKTALCLSDVKVQERQRLSCNCTVNSTSSISSVPLECQ